MSGAITDHHGGQQRTVLALVLCCGLAGTGAADDSDRVREAHVFCQRGEYVAAERLCREILSAQDVIAPLRTQATLTCSRACQSIGQWEQAREVIDAELERQPGEPRLWSRLAELEYLRGEHAAATLSTERAIELDADAIGARLIKAHLSREAGKFDEALAGYLWCVRFYNRKQPTDAETLLLVAEGSLEYARWKGVSSIYDFVVNTLCPDALASDKDCWQASLMSGELLLEKYNRPQAIPELQAALRINPHAAEAYVALGQAALQEHDLSEARQLADKALALNDRLPSALRLAADVQLGGGDPQSALARLQEASRINPVDQRTRAREATCYLALDGIPGLEHLQRVLSGELSSSNQGAPAGARFDRVCADVLGQNPSPGEFLACLGEFLDARRKYEAAQWVLVRAIEVMPQLSAPRTALGLLAMRTGRLVEARQILDSAFQADPYHVRVHNMRKVMEVLDSYITIETAHFLIRVPEDERLLGEAMSDYLESIYTELTGQFGFEPPGKTQVEVYGPAKGHSAHQWFSARMVGLPWIQTIGASTGLIIALASPHSAPEPFNWARVLRHEFVHILTLQQTDFNIPHWYTEALAVRVEGAHPDEWLDLLLERVPAGETFDLLNINRGFQQPQGPSDWQMAYCQSSLYADYIAANYGEDALARLLEAFGRNLSTPEAIREVCGVDLVRLEQDYRNFLEDHVDRIARGREPLLDDLADLGGAAKDLTRLAAAFDSQRPHPAVVEALANAHLAADRLDEARHVLQAGVDTFPLERRFLRQLAAVLVRQHDQVALRPVLEGLASQDLDDGLVRRKLAQLAFDAEDWPAAVHWGLEATYCDLREPATHHLLGQAYAATRNWPQAIHHFEIALSLDESLKDARDELEQARQQSSSPAHDVPHQ